MESATHFCNHDRHDMDLSRKKNKYFIVIFLSRSPVNINISEPYKIDSDPPITTQWVVIGTYPNLLQENHITLIFTHLRVISIFIIVLAYFLFNYF